jgi:hypothetical protein
LQQQLLSFLRVAATREQKPSSEHQRSNNSCPGKRGHAAAAAATNVLANMRRESKAKIQNLPHSLTTMNKTNNRGAVQCSAGKQTLGFCFSSLSQAKGRRAPVVEETLGAFPIQDSQTDFHDKFCDITLASCEHPRGMSPKPINSFKTF